MAGFARVGGTLLCDGVPLEEAAARFGTPLYLYSRACLEEGYARYEAAFAPVPHRICYALKANGSGALLRILAGLGAGADIVSGMELRAALRAGFPPDRIVFAGVGKTEEELALGLAEGIGVFNVESEDEIVRLAGLARSARLRARICLRVNPDVDPRSHPYVATGLRQSKFGVEISRAPEILRRARARAELEIVGLHCHIGSQITDLEPLQESVRGLVEASVALLGEGFELKTVDIGGGLGVDYEGGGTPDPVALADRVLPALNALPLTVLVEPGRSLTAPAAALLTRILYRKENGGRRFVVVDAGMNDLIRPALYGAYHRIEPVRSQGRPSSRVDIVGPICESGDFLARDRELEDVDVGEILAVRDAGAYGFAMSSRYNLRPRAAEALVEQGALRLIRRRETFEDLVATEVP